MLLSETLPRGGIWNISGTKVGRETIVLDDEIEGRLLYEARAGAITPSMYGELCVCWLADGTLVAKRPFPGQEPGTFDLLSLYAPPLTGHYVLQAALVIEIQPAASLERKSRRLADLWGQLQNNLTPESKVA